MSTTSSYLIFLLSRTSKKASYAVSIFVLEINIFYNIKQSFLILKVKKRSRNEQIKIFAFKFLELRLQNTKKLLAMQHNFFSVLSCVQCLIRSATFMISQTFKQIAIISG